MVLGRRKVSSSAKSETSRASTVSITATTSNQHGDQSGPDSGLRDLIATMGDKIVAEKTIRVFLSSPFGGMEEERSVLVNKYLPRLRGTYDKKGIYFSFVDLRWGITGAQAAENLIVEICLREIEQSHIFIGFIGRRYGSRDHGGEDTAWMRDSFQRALAGFPWIDKFRDRGLTEVEFRAGFLNDPHLRPSIVFFRDHAYDIRKEEENKGNDIEAAKYRNTDPSEELLLKELTEEVRLVRQESPVQVMDYGVPEKAAEKIYKWLLLITRAIPNLQDNVNPSALSAADKGDIEDERTFHAAFADIRRRVFVAGGTNIEHIDKHLKNSIEPLVITGAAGCGKSALLANWIEHRQRTHPADRVFYHFTGCTPESTLLITLLRRIAAEDVAARRRVGVHASGRDAMPTDDRGLVKYLRTKRQTPNALGGLVILVIDALNQFENEELMFLPRKDPDGRSLNVNNRFVHQLGWLPKMFPPGVRIIVATPPDGDTKEALRLREGVAFMEIQALSVDATHDMVAQLLRQDNKQGLSKEQEELLLKGNPMANNPLWLSLVSQELVVFGDHHQLTQKIKELRACDSLPVLVSMILERHECAFRENSRETGSSKAVAKVEEIKESTSTTNETVVSSTKESGESSEPNSTRLQVETSSPSYTGENLGDISSGDSPVVRRRGGKIHRKFLSGIASLSLSPRSKKKTNAFSVMLKPSLKSEKDDDLPTGIIGNSSVELSGGRGGKRGWRSSTPIIPDRTRKFLRETSMSSVSSVDSNIVRSILQLVALSSTGITESELISVLHISSSTWSLVHFSLRQLLVERSRRFGFIHDYIRIAVSTRYLSSPEHVCVAHAQLGSLFAQFWKERRQVKRVVEELPGHFLKAKMWGELCDILADPSFTEARYGTQPIIIDSVDFSLDVAQHLGEALCSNNSVHILKLNGIPINIDRLRDPAFSELSMPASHLQDIHVGVIAGVIIANQSIVSIRLPCNVLGPDGISVIVKAAKSLKFLRVLDLWGNRTGDQGVTAIARSLLSSSRSLKDLSIAAFACGAVGPGSIISPSCSKLLGESLYTNSVLLTLNLRGVGLGDVGAEHIAMALRSKHTAMRNLYLDWNDIGNSGAEHLAAMLKVNKNLRLLDLSFNCIGEESVDFLTKIKKGHKSLTDLFINQQNVFLPPHVESSSGNTGGGASGNENTGTGTNEDGDVKLSRSIGDGKHDQWPQLNVLMVGDNTSLSPRLMYSFVRNEPPLAFQNVPSSKRVVIDRRQVDLRVAGLWGKSTFVGEFESAARTADAYILVFSIYSRASLLRSFDYHRQLVDFGEEELRPIVFVAHNFDRVNWLLRSRSNSSLPSKTNLTEEKALTTSVLDEARRRATELGCLLIETDADVNGVDMFFNLVRLTRSKQEVCKRNAQGGFSKDRRNTWKVWRKIKGSSVIIESSNSESRSKTPTLGRSHGARARPKSFISQSMGDLEEQSDIDHVSINSPTRSLADFSSTAVVPIVTVDAVSQNDAGSFGGTVADEFGSTESIAHRLDVVSPNLKDDDKDGAAVTVNVPLTVSVPHISDTERHSIELPMLLSAQEIVELLIKRLSLSVNPSRYGLHLCRNSLKGDREDDLVDEWLHGGHTLWSYRPNAEDLLELRAWPLEQHTVRLVVPTEYGAEGPITTFEFNQFSLVQEAVDKHCESSNGSSLSGLRPYGPSIGMWLDFSKPLASYEIPDGDVIEFKEWYDDPDRKRKRVIFKVRVLTSDVQRSVTLNLFEDSSVGEAIAAVLKRKDIIVEPRTEYCLYRSVGGWLDNHTLLVAFNNLNGSENVELRARRRPVTFRVASALPNSCSLSSTVVVLVNYDERVRDLVARLDTELKVAWPGRYHISRLDGLEVSDDERIFSLLDVKSGDTALTYRMMPKKLIVELDEEEGSELTLMIDRSITVESLRCTIARTYGIPEEKATELRIMHKGTELAIEQSLIEAGVDGGSDDNLDRVTVAVLDESNVDRDNVSSNNGYPALTRDPSTIRFGHNKTVMAGTLDTLIDYLADGSVDADYRNTFLLMYRSFSTSEYVLDKIALLYHICRPARMSIQDFLAFRSDTQSRLFETLKDWVTLTSDFQEDTALCARLMDLVNHIDEDHPRASACIVSKLALGIKSAEHKKRQIAFFQRDRAAMFRNVKLLDIFDIETSELAAQLTLRDHFLFSSVQPKELMNNAWLVAEGSNRGAPNVTAVVQSMNELSQFVATSIISDPIQKVRTQRYVYFIDLAFKLKELKNFSSFVAIVNGLHHSAVVRLKKTRKAVDRRSLERIGDMEVLASPVSNYAALRCQLASVEPPCVPYLGVFLADLVFLNDAIPNYIDKNHINFDKHRRIYDIISKVLCVQGIPYEKLTVKLPVCEAMIHLKNTLSDYALTKLSFVREPMTVLAQ